VTSGSVQAMKLIVGLGNPDPEYEATWHNLGFRVIDGLAERKGIRRFRIESEAQVAQAECGGEPVILVKPQTYMNLSGNAVRPLLERYALGDPASLIVICDDIALPLGMIRVRGQGSAGGQKGLKSVIERLGTQQFCRVRLGIKPEHRSPTWRNLCSRAFREGRTLRLTKCLARRLMQSS